MKIIINKEVKIVTESLEVKEGIYYFSKDNSCVFYKVDLEEDREDGFLTWDITEINNYSDEKSVKLYSDGGEFLPKFIADLFIKDAEKVTEDVFDKNLNFILKKFHKK